jgi:hypothetical protein
MNKPTDPFIEGVTISTNKIKFKKLFNKTIFILIIIQGLYGLYITTRNILVVYPKLSLYYQQLNFDPSVYHQLLQEAVLLSVSSFIEVAFGLTMAIKKSSSVKTIHTIIAIIVLLVSLYLKREGAIPDLDAIEKLAYVF